MPKIKPPNPTAISNEMAALNNEPGSRCDEDVDTMINTF
jgi:hypothetical protein